jgi:uncharacterized membrane-anchored protein
MRSKQSISNKLDIIESRLANLKYTLGTNDRAASYTLLKEVSSIISDINTLLNRETQD